MRKSDVGANQQERRNLTTQEAYLLGVHLTDGCTYVYDGGIRSNGYGRGLMYMTKLTALDRDFVEEWSAIVEEAYGGKPPKVVPKRRSGQTYWQARAWKKPLVEFLDRETQEKTAFPDSLTEASREVKLAFLKGALDGDGYVQMSKDAKNRRYRYHVGFANTNRWLVEGVRKILQSLGVKVGGIKEQNLRSVKNSRKRYWRIIVNMHSLIDAEFQFGVARKNDRLILYRLGLFKLVSPETIRQTLANAKEDMVRSGRRLSELGRNDLAAYLPK